MIEISLTEGKSTLEKDFFHSKNEETFSFLPSEFCNWAIQSGLQTTFCAIEKWEDFEYDRTDLDEMDFYNLIFEAREHRPDSNVLFISDESIKKQIAFSFKVSEFRNFASYYENTFHMAFFQPHDYIVYIEDYREIRIIHHEGKLIKIIANQMPTDLL